MASGGRGRVDRSEISPFVKYALFFSNFLFFILSLAAWCLGAWILSEKEKIIETVIDFIFDPVIMLMMVGGLLTFLIAFCGCCGSLRENTVMLKMYHITMSILLFFELIAIIFVFVFYFQPDVLKQWNIYPEANLKDAIKRYREDDDVKDFIDNIQRSLKCCGLSNDEKGYLDWNENAYFNCSDINKSHEKCAVPYSCCVLNEGDTINFLCGKGALEQSDPAQLQNVVNTKGCLKGLGDFIQENAFVIGGVILGVLIPQILFICFAKQLVDQIKLQMSKWR